MKYIYFFLGAIALLIVNFLYQHYAVPFLSKYIWEWITTLLFPVVNFFLIIGLGALVGESFRFSKWMYPIGFIVTFLFCIIFFCSSDYRYYKNNIELYARENKMDLNQAQVIYDNYYKEKTTQTGFIGYLINRYTIVVIKQDANSEVKKEIKFDWFWLIVTLILGLTSFHSMLLKGNPFDNILCRSSA